MEVVICYGRGMLQGASRHCQIRRRVLTGGKMSVRRRLEQNVRFGIRNDEEFIHECEFYFSTIFGFRTRSRIF